MTATGVDGGVLYEVTLDVEAAIADEYRSWLDAHVAQMLALPGFVSAQCFAITEPVETGRRAWCVHYRLRDADALAHYLREQAPAMRADGLARFGTRFRAQRRVMHPDA